MSEENTKFTSTFEILKIEITIFGWRMQNYICIVCAFISGMLRVNGSQPMPAE